MAAGVLAGVQRLQTGVALGTIDDFFQLFPAIYALTSTPASLARATRGVLSHFLDPPSSNSTTHATTAPEVAYIELRTTPRETAHMSRRAYLETVLDEIEVRPPDAAALIVSLDRRMTPEVAREVLALAVQLRREGRRVVGVDLCGDPTVRLPFSRASTAIDKQCVFFSFFHALLLDSRKAGDMTDFVELFRTARAEGLGVTLHIAEVGILAECQA
jgi:adenosine deaminase